MSETTDGIATLGYELGLLKRIRRAGWWQAGVRDPESVAEHTMRTAQLAALLAVEEGGNPERAAYLALWHDTQETRTSDIPHSAKPYMNKADARAVTHDQTATLGRSAAQSIRDAVDEYENASTIDARCAKDADKLEMLLQAAEYRDVGVDRVDGWVHSARTSLTTDTAHHTAESALALSPLSWRDR